MPGFLAAPFPRCRSSLLSTILGDFCLSLSHFLLSWISYILVVRVYYIPNIDFRTITCSRWFIAIVFSEDSTIIKPSQKFGLYDQQSSNVWLVSRDSHVSLQCLRKAFTPLGQRGIDFLPICAVGDSMDIKLLEKVYIKIVQGSQKGRLPESTKAHSTLHIYRKSCLNPSSKSSSCSQGFSSAAAT